MKQFIPNSKSPVFGVLFFCMSFSYTLLAQTPDVLIPYRDKDDWGWANTKGEIAIKPAYDSVFYHPYLYSRNCFPEKRYHFKLDGELGMLSPTGEIIIKGTFEDLYDKFGFIVIKNNGLTGLLDAQQRELFPIQYEYLSIVQHSDNLFFVEVKSGNNEQYGLYEIRNGNLKNIIPVAKHYIYGLKSGNSKKQTIEVDEGRLIYEISTTGEVSLISEIKPTNTDDSEFVDMSIEDDVDFVDMIVDEDEFVDTGLDDFISGDQIVKREDKPKQINKPMAVGIDTYKTDDGKFKLIVKKTELYQYGLPHAISRDTLETKYDAVEDIKIPVFIDEAKGLVSKKNGLHPKSLLVATKNGNKGIVDAMGKMVIPFEYEDFLSTILPYQLTGEGEFKVLIIAKKNGKWGMINRKNEERTEFIYDEIYPLQDFQIRWKYLRSYPFDEGIIVRKGKNYGIINLPTEGLLSKGHNWSVNIEMDNIKLFRKPNYKAHSYQLFDEGVYGFVERNRKIMPVSPYPVVKIERLEQSHFVLRCETENGEFLGYYDPAGFPYFKD